jgi:thiol-disulfide isomerase/thioredoxin
MLKRTLTIAALLFTAGQALAQDAKPAATPATPTEKKVEPAKATKLSIGDTAPALEVEKFLKGNEVTGFEKGRVYVVEFWATWCGPCIAAMPHVSKLQKQYKDTVTIIGVNIWEDKNYDEKTFAKANDFVKAQGDRMAYTVAYDGSAKKMDTNYMKAAGRNGIPSAFVVNQDGKVAWMGHPMWLDAVLADVVAKKWDLATSPAKLTAAEKQLSEIMRKAGKDGKGALADWSGFEKEHPAVAEAMSDTKLRLLLAAGEFTDAYKIMNKQADEAIASKDAMKLNEIAWTIVDPDGKIEKKDLDLAFKAASKGAEFAKGTDEEGMILDSLARVHFLKGEIDKAIEIQTNAVELTKNEQMKDQLKDSLKEYQDAKSKK